MMKEEFAAMGELYNTTPSSVPKPIAKGQFQLPGPPAFFLLNDFIDMSNEMADPNDLCDRLLTLHGLACCLLGNLDSISRPLKGNYCKSLSGILAGHHPSPNS